MTPYDTGKLKAAQNASLEILLEVDRICRSKGIDYLLDSGTLLGAVRHGGFIPWDDDIDIAMTRDSFERFRAASELLPEGLELVMPDSYRQGRVFYDFTPRIIYKASRRHADGSEMQYYDGKLNHLWVDIFILDGIPDSIAADRWTRFCQKFIYGCSMHYRYGIDYSKYSPSYRAGVRVLSFLGGLIGMPRLFRMQHRLSVKYSGSPTKRLYYSNYQPDYLDCTVSREWVENTQRLSFEGHMLEAPQNHDAVLKVIYGDYMQLPPEEQRVPSHSDELEVFSVRRQ